MDNGHWPVAKGMAQSTEELRLKELVRSGERLVDRSHRALGTDWQSILRFDSGERFVDRSASGLL